MYEPRVIGSEKIVATVSLPGLSPFKYKTNDEPGVMRAGILRAVTLDRNFIDNSMLPTLPVIVEVPDHDSEFSTFFCPAKTAVPPVAIFGLMTGDTCADLAEVVVDDETSVVDFVGSVVVVVVSVDCASGAVVVVVVSVDGAAGSVVVGVESSDGGLGLFEGGDWFDGAWHGVAACCQRRNGLVCVSQIPHVFGLVPGFAQPASMLHPALSKNSWVLIADAETSDRAGCVPPWSLSHPIGLRPLTPASPASQYEVSTVVDGASPSNAPTLFAP